jgi:hypothetical protein
MIDGDDFRAITVVSEYKGKPKYPKKTHSCAAMSTIGSK